MKLLLKVVPGATRSGIAGRLGDRVKVKVTEQAESGRANAAVIAVLAAALGIPRSGLKIVAGGKSPLKVVEIASMSEDEVLARLADYGV
ncbi:MAG: DUF167 family protein [Halieaceae bacterium]|nr:DUF167 family protein [Halieaceae bacterium]